MSAVLKLDRPMVLTRLRWQSEVGEELAYPIPTANHFGIYSAGDFSEVPPEKMELGVNAKVQIPLDCSVAPLKYHCLIAPNPKLFEVAEVSCVSWLVPGSDRIRPTISLRGLRKFDLSSLDWVATIHMM